MNHSFEHQSSYRLWTWLVAILLALILLWMLLTGRGQSNACCDITTEAAIAVETMPVETMPIEAMPAKPVTVNEAFSFVATSNNFTSKGDGANVAWLSQAQALNAILSGEDLRMQGDDKNVLLSGIVDSDAIKQQKGAHAQAFFGPDIIVNNQLVIKASR